MDNLRTREVHYSHTLMIDLTHIRLKAQSLTGSPSHLRNYLHVINSEIETQDILPGLCSDHYHLHVLIRALGIEIRREGSSGYVILKLYSILYSSDYRSEGLLYFCKVAPKVVHREGLKMKGIELDWLIQRENKAIVSTVYTSLLLTLQLQFRCCHTVYLFTS
jgi:hypothetical protein